MGKIIISENITLDGVIQDPTGEEGTTFGGWFTHLGVTDRAAWAQAGLDEALRSDALLLGRRTYEFLGSRWPARSGEWADRLNGMPKFVVSSTLEDAGWNNSTVLRGDVLDDVSQLRESVSGEIVVNASGQLAQTLMEHDLFDGLRLMLYPFVAGGGTRLFTGASGQQPMRLLTTRTVGDSLLLLDYERVARNAASPARTRVTSSSST